MSLGPSVAVRAVSLETGGAVLRHRFLGLHGLTVR
jgi:hypothetical protein